MPTKKRIALFAPGFPGGGRERSFLNLLKGWEGSDIDVELVLGRAAGPYLRDVPGYVRVVDLRVGRPTHDGNVAFSDLLKQAIALARHLATAQPHALMSSGVYPNLAAVVAVYLAGFRGRGRARLVLRQENHNSANIALLRRHRAGRLRPWITRLAYPLADAVIAISSAVGDDLVANFGVPHDKVRVVYNPAYTDDIAARAREPSGHPWLEEAAGGGTPVVLGVGRLTPQKDFPTLIEAFARVRATRAARLVVLGEGAERATLEDCAKRHGVSGDIDMPGFVDNPFAYMAQASVFALSSRFEGFGNVVVEALACGCPVVSTDCPSGPAEILEGGRYGKLVPVGDAEAMARAIVEALESPPDRQALVERARDFDFRTIAAQYLHHIVGDVR